MTARDSQILCGLFLSKFNEQALNALGFESFAEAFNVLGSALSVSPATIKNYRDELDPHFPNPRQGWHKRPLRVHCKAILEAYGTKSFADLAALVKTLFDPTADLAEPMAERGSEEDIEESTFAKRLITGRAAEGFFRAHYHRQVEWRGGSLVDTTLTGCGFDFRINFADSAAFHAVEVKGIFGSRGSILLTQREYSRANQLRERFFLYVVRNFGDSPSASVWRDPLHTDLNWQLISQQQTIATWRTSL